MGEFAGIGALDPTPGGWSTSPPSSPAPGRPPRSAARRTASPGTSRPACVYYRTDLAKKAGLDAAPDRLGRAEGVRQGHAGQGRREVRHRPPGRAAPAPGRRSCRSRGPTAPSSPTTAARSTPSTAPRCSRPEVLQVVLHRRHLRQGRAGRPRRPSPTSPTAQVPMFISGPWMMSAVEEAGGAEFKDKYDVVPIPAKTRRPTSFIGGGDLGGLQERQEPRRRLEVRPVAVRPQDPGQVVRAGRPTCPAVKSAWQDPALTADPKLAGLRQAARDRPGPAGVPDLGAGRDRDRHRDGEGHQDRRRPGRCTEDRAEAGRVHRHRHLTMSTATERTPRQRRRRPAARRAGHPAAGAGSRRLRRAGGVGPRAAVLLLFLVFTVWPVLQSLFMSFTDTKATRHPHPVRGRLRRPRQLHQGARPTRVPQGDAQHRLLRRRRGAPDHALALAAAVALDRGITRSASSSGSASTCRSSPPSSRSPWSGGSSSGTTRPGQHRPRLGRHRRARTGSATPNWRCPSLIVMAAWRNFGTR